MTRAVLLAALFLAGCGRGPDDPLSAAAAAGDTTEVQRLIAAGGDPNGRDLRRGWTPLLWAAREGRPATVATLVSLGADPNRADRSENRWTPLLHAIHGNHPAAVAALLQHGADPNLGAVDGPTPLISAASADHAAIVRLLLAGGADPRRHSGAISPLGAALAGGPTLGRLASRPCPTDTVRLLREAAPDVTLPKDFWGRNARLFAAIRGCSETLDLLKDE